MRSLATDAYTAAQVEAALHAATGRFSCRFDLLDDDLNYVADLSPWVRAADLDVDTERPIKGGLNLTLAPDSDLPVDDLATALWRYCVKPWWQVVMDDGGVAAYPLGVFSWVKPDRAVEGQRDQAHGGVVQEWTAKLGDLGHWIDLSGPGPGGFKVVPSDLVTDVIVRVLKRLGFRDMSGVKHSTQKAGSYYTWSLVRNTTARPWRVDAAHPYGISITSNTTVPETWRTVLGDLTDAIGYDEVWFNGDGVPQVGPARALQRTDPDKVYDTEKDQGLILSMGASHEWSRIANRVFCRAQRKSGTLYYGMADADKVVPGHPLSHGVTNRYVDLVVDVPATASASALEAQARSILLKRLATFQVVELEAMIWPVHEPFDVVGLAFSGDDEFDAPAIGGSSGGEFMFHQASYRATLRADDDSEGRMTHQLHRTVQVR